jgi:hypothetical protein
MTTLNIAIGENVVSVEYYHEDHMIDDVHFDQVDEAELYVRENGEFVTLKSVLLRKALEEYHRDGHGDE